jgi:hypothetical protein
MGIGDWGLGIGDWGLGPIPNPQLFKFILILFLIYKLRFILINYLLFSFKLHIKNLTLHN